MDLNSLVMKLKIPLCWDCICAKELNLFPPSIWPEIISVLDHIHTITQNVPLDRSRGPARFLAQFLRQHEETTVPKSPQFTVPHKIKFVTPQKKKKTQISFSQLS